MSEKPKGGYATWEILLAAVLSMAVGLSIGVAITKDQAEKREAHSISYRGDETEWCTPNERSFIDAYQAHHRNPDKPEKAEQMEAWRTIMVAGWGSYPREAS